MDPFDANKAMRLFRFEAQATGSAFIGTVFAVAGGDGDVRLCAVDGSFNKLKVHDGAILGIAANSKGDVLYTGGDDGNVKRIGADGSITSIHEGRKWVDTIACSPRGHIAWSCGKTIYLAKEGEAAIEIAAPSSVGALTFSGDGKWLGAAVYGGALLISPNQPDKQKFLEWKGSHQAIGFSTDGRFCVTAMLENSLHVWKIDSPDKHGQMGGYPARPLSFGWTSDGRGMLTAGADVLVMWPFSGSDGPIGQSAAVFEGVAMGILRSVISRPRTRQILIGYAEGGVGLFDRKDDSFSFIAEADGSPVIDVRFSPDGRYFGFIRENGSAGYMDMGKV